MAKLNLKARGRPIKTLPSVLTVGEFDSVLEVKELISEETGLDINRIRLSIPLADKQTAPAGKKAPELALKDNQKIGDFSPELVLVKDLGPQISWRLVYFIEYLCPLVINPIIFLFPKYIYGQSFTHTAEQTLVFGLVMLHFLKREFETLLVHKFSLATMPLKNLFRNSLYYGIFSGLNLAYFTYAPPSFAYSNNLFKKFLFGKILDTPEWAVPVLGGLWLFAELSNFYCHQTLANLRPAGSTKRFIPYGYGFNLVSCPNYFFETLGWVAVSLITQNWAAYIFTIVGTLQMFQWAVQRHKRYHREFKNYPKNRKIYFPFLL